MEQIRDGCNHHLLQACTDLTSSSSTNQSQILETTTNCDIFRSHRDSCFPRIPAFQGFNCICHISQEQSDEWLLSSSREASMCTSNQVITQESRTKYRSQPHDSTEDHSEIGYCLRPDFNVGYWDSNSCRISRHSVDAYFAGTNTIHVLFNF